PTRSPIRLTRRSFATNRNPSLDRVQLAGPYPENLKNVDPRDSRAVFQARPAAGGICFTPKSENRPVWEIRAWNRNLGREPMIGSPARKVRHALSLVDQLQFTGSPSQYCRRSS